MRGIVSETFPYVLEQERDLLPDEQTIFHLKVVTAGESSASLRRYSKSFINKAGGTQDLNEGAYRVAYRSEFLDVVRKVENYQFGYKYPDLQEKGYFSFEEPDLFAKMFEELPDAVVRELIEAAKGKATMEELDSKKSQSPSSTVSGKRQN